MIKGIEGVLKILRILLPVLLGGCRFLNEYLNMSAPEIVHTFPDTEHVTIAALEEIRIEFSVEMEEAKTEQAFSLAEEEQSLDGRFAWEGATFSFRPTAGFHENKRYTMRVSTEAEDRYGNSLDREFVFSFSTGTDSERPCLLSHTPADGATAVGLREPLHFVFSEPVNRESAYRALSLSPPVRGTFDWADGDSQLTFTPLEDYPAGDPVDVELSTELCDLSGNMLGEAFHFTFSTGIAPELSIVGITAQPSGSDLQPTGTLLLNHGIEKDDNLRIVLSGEVPPDRRDSLVSLSPSVSFQSEWEAGYRACLLKPRQYLEYGAVYELTLLQSTYRFIVDGPRSRPPDIRMITFCPDAASPSFTTLELSTNLNLGDMPRACFDFYIGHAASSEVDLSSFLKAVSVGTHPATVAISFSSVQRNPTSPAPVPSPEAEVTVIRMLCAMTDSGGSGILTLAVDTNLKDTFDNHLAQEYRLQVSYH